MQGDRDKITLFGPGAGAASAGLLAVMPKTRSVLVYLTCRPLDQLLIEFYENKNLVSAELRAESK